jgi:hypothetical protein
MDMIDEEIRRLKIRLDELTVRILPDFENKTQILYSQILPLPKDNAHREKLEAEYVLLSKELTLRSDEVIRIRQQIENLELEKNIRR